METQLKQPTPIKPSKQTLSAADAKRVEHFKDLLTVGADADFLRKLLTGLYFKYTRLLTIDTDKISDDTETELYYLAEIISVFE